VRERRYERERHMGKEKGKDIDRRGDRGSKRKEREKDIWGKKKVKI
jgi:hypothetical protein